MTLDSFDLNIVKQLFKQICKDYANHAATKAKTITGSVSTFFSARIGFSNSNKTLTFNKELITRIDNLQSADLLIQLLLTLVKEAYKSQSETALSYSDYSASCYAIIQLIVRLPEIAENEKRINPKLAIHQDILDLPAKLNSKIQEIQKALESKKIENKGRVHHKEKVNMDVTYELMRSLYFLGDHHSDYDPNYIKLIFPESHFLWPKAKNYEQEINENFPLVIQPNFAEIHIKTFNPHLEDDLIHRYIIHAVATVPSQDAKHTDNQDTVHATARIGLSAISPMSNPRITPKGIEQQPGSGSSQKHTPFFTSQLPPATGSAPLSTTASAQPQMFNSTTVPSSMPLTLIGSTSESAINSASASSSVAAALNIGALRVQIPDHNTTIMTTTPEPQVQQTGKKAKQKHIKNKQGGSRSSSYQIEPASSPSLSPRS